MLNESRPLFEGNILMVGPNENIAKERATALQLRQEANKHHFSYQVPEVFYTTPARIRKNAALQQLQIGLVVGVTSGLHDNLLTVTQHLATQIAIQLNVIAMPESFIIFDMDDTILEGGLVYINNEKKVVDYLADKLALSPQLVLAERKIQFDNIITQMGICRELQRQTNLMTLEVLSERHGKQDTIMAEHRATCVALADEIYTAKVDLYPGTIWTLNTMLSMGAELFLATRGDRPSQYGKINDNDLVSYFSEFYCWPTKTTEHFLEVVAEQRLPRSFTAVVGDGLGSDIQPALEAGLHAIHVDTSNFERDGRANIKVTFPSVPAIEDVPQTWLEKIALYLPSRVQPKAA